MPVNLFYQIGKKDMAFAVTVSSMVKPNGLIAAFFKPNTAIDANGHVFTLQQDDWDALVQLAEATTSLPKSGGKNMWEFKELTTCPSTEFIHVATPNGLYATTISAWINEDSELVHPVGNITRLPEALRSLLGYAYEGFGDYKGYMDTTDGNLSFEKAVMALLNPDYCGF